MEISHSLIVLAIVLTLGIKNTGPVVGFKVELVVDIYLDFDVLARLLDGVNRDANWAEGTAQKLSKTRGAPLHNGTSLQVELGSKDGVTDGSLTDLTEGQGLVDRWALVSQSVHGTVFVHGNANSQSTSLAGSR